MRFWRWMIGASAAALVLDRLLKWYALRGASGSLGPLEFHVSHNTQLALSIPAPWIVILTLNTVLTLCVLTWFVQSYRRARWWSAGALLLVSAGALSNLADRIFLGGVTDYLSVTTPVLGTGAFNIADAMIVVGIGLLIIGELKNERAIA